MGELSKLKGIGPKSGRCQNEVGITTRERLRKVGPVRAFIILLEGSSSKPRLNFLYALVGALEEKHWATIAQSEKSRR